MKLQLGIWPLHVTALFPQETCTHSMCSLWRSKPNLFYQSVNHLGTVQDRIAIPFINLLQSPTHVNPAGPAQICTVSTNSKTSCTVLQTPSKSWQRLFQPMPDHHRHIQKKKPTRSRSQGMYVTSSRYVTASLRQMHPRGCHCLCRICMHRYSEALCRTCDQTHPGCQVTMWHTPMSTFPTKH